MASLNTVIEFIDSNFKTRNNEGYIDETGVTYDAGQDIKRVGYATNLTPEVIEKANKQNIDLIITHHDAWEFIYGLKEECDRLLKKYNISHYFNHLPLDDSDFGTNNSLASELGLEVVKRGCNENGFLCGVVAEFKEGKSFESFVKTAEQKLEEKVQAWKFNDRDIKRVFIICGAGFMTSNMKEAIDEECDLYLTGEKILYTVEYAKLHNLNLVIGSHTFTEVFGVRSLANIVAKHFEDIVIEQIVEEHLEAKVYL